MRALLTLSVDGADPFSNEDGEQLADDFDFDAEVEFFPGGIGGVDGCFALDGKGQAGAVGKREAVGPGLGDQFSCEAGLEIVEEANLKTEGHYAAPCEVGAYPAQHKARVHLGQVDRAEDAPSKVRENDVAPRFVEDDCQNCRGIQNGRAIQATPPSRGGPLRGGRR